MPIPFGYLIRDRWSLGGTGVQIGGAINGDTQIVAGPTPWWTCDLEYRVQKTKFLAWEAWLESRQGQIVTDLVVPTPDRMIQGHSGTWDGGILWDDSVEWSGGLAIRAIATAPQFAQSITVDVPDEFVVGAFFFIGRHGYRVTSITGHVVNFLPGLRKRLLNGTPILGIGAFTMHLADETASVERDQGKTFDITLRFKERLS